MVGSALVSRRNIIVIAVILLVLLLVGSLWDQEISAALYDPDSVFGRFFAAAGALPVGLALAGGGTLFIAARNRDRQVVGAAQTIGGALLLCASAIYTTGSISSYSDMPTIWAGVIGATLSAAVAVIVVRLCREADRHTVLRVAAALVLTIIVELIVVNILKLAWQRPRMYLVAGESSVDFAAWWMLGNDSKSILISTGILADAFNSFPSAHTSGAATLMLLTTLVALRQSLTKYSGLLLWTGVLWAGIVAFSRIIMGAHFVSDTVVGFAVTFGVMLLTYRLVIGVRRVRA